MSLCCLLIAVNLWNFLQEQYDKFLADEQEKNTSTLQSALEVK